MKVYFYQKKNIKKIKCKNLEFYTGKVGDWHSVVIISLDKNDYYEYYRSDNKRYLLCVIKNSDYNFCINDASVYDFTSVQLTRNSVQ